MYRRILVPVALFESPPPALQHAVALAKVMGAELLLLQVITVVPSSEAFFQQVQVEIGSRAYKKKAEGEKFLKRMEQLLQEEGVSSQSHLVISDKSEAEIIAEYAEREACDLIVVPNDYHTGIGRWLFSSLGDKVRRHADVPVLFV